MVDAQLLLLLLAVQSGGGGTDRSEPLCLGSPRLASLSDRIAVCVCLPSLCADASVTSAALVAMSHSDLREIDLQSNPFLLALQGASAGAVVAGKGGGSKAAAAAAALSTALAALFEQVAARGGLVLLPPPAHCPKLIDERWATRHILLPADGADNDRSRAVSAVTGSPSGGEVELAGPAPSRWIHPDGSAAHIAAGVVYEGEAGCGDDGGSGGARVLLEELHYDDEFRSFKVLCLDRAMWPPPGGRAAAGQGGPPARKGSVSAGDRSSGLHPHAHSAGAPVPPASASSSLQQQLRRPRDRSEFRSLSEHRDVLTSVLGEGVATHAIFASPRLDFFFTDFSLAWLGVVARDESRAAEHIRAACARTLAEAITCIKQGSVANPLTPSSGSVASGAGGAAGGGGPATAKSLAQWSPGRYAELEIAIQAHVHSCLHSKIFNATLAKLPVHRAAADRLSKALAALAEVGGVSLFDVGLSPHLVGLVDPRAAVEHMRSLHTFVTPLERMSCLARVEAALMDSISATSATNKTQLLHARAGPAGVASASGAATNGSTAVPPLARNATLPAGGLSAQVSSLLHASPSAASTAGSGAGATMSSPTGAAIGVRSGASSFHRPRSLTQCNLFAEGSEAPFAVAGPFAQQQAVAPLPSSVSSPSSRATSAAINITGAAASAASTTDGVMAGSSSPQRSRLNLPPLSSSPGPPLPPKQRGKHSPGGGGGPGTPSSSPPSQLSSIPPPLSLQPQAQQPPQETSSIGTAAAAGDPAPVAPRRRKSSAPAPLSVSADDLLPLLVFVLVEARPPAVHANIAYMRAYSPGPALLTPSVHSELHYRLANFEAAVSYVESGRLLQHVRESQAAREQEQQAASASAASSASANAGASASGPKRRARPRMSSISIQSTRTLHLLLTPQSSSSSRRNLFNGDAASTAPSGVGSGAGTANSSVANSRRASTDGSNALVAEALATNGDASAAAIAAAAADGDQLEEEEEHSMFDADVEGLDEEDEEDACIDPRLLGSAFARFGAGGHVADTAGDDADGVCSDGDMPDLFARASAGRALRRSSRSAEPLFHQARRAASGGDGSAMAAGGSGNAAAAAASLFGCSIPEPDSLLSNGASLPAWLTGASTDGAAATHSSPSRSRSPVAAPLVVATGDLRIPTGRTRSDTVVRAPMAPFLPHALSSSAIAATASAVSGTAFAAVTSSSTSPSSANCNGGPSSPAALSPSLAPLPSHPSWSSSVLSSPLVPLREALDEDDLDPLGALIRTKKPNKAN